MYSKLTHKKDYNILVKRSLLWGSVKPDFIRHRIPHYKYRGTKGFYKKIDQLEQSAAKLTPKEFSLELGQIFHYLADYFCQAHNKQYFINKTRFHVLNEIRLQRYFKKLNKDFFDFNIIGNRPKNIIDIIETEHLKFQQEEFSFANDLKYTFRILMIIGNKLLSSYVAQRQKGLAA